MFTIRLTIYTYRNLTKMIVHNHNREENKGQDIGYNEYIKSTNATF